MGGSGIGAGAGGGLEAGRPLVVRLREAARQIDGVGLTPLRFGPLDVARLMREAADRIEQFDPEAGVS